MAPPIKAANRKAVKPARGLLTLGIETGGDHLSVALVDWVHPADYDIREEIISLRGPRSADALLVRVREMLQQHAFTIGDVKLVAVGRGPGGFTGIRVGLATALGLAIGGAVPVWPVCSLTSLAVEGAALSGILNRTEVHRVAALIDARRGEIYGAAFDIQAGVATAVLGPVAMALSDFRSALGALSPAAPTLFVGSGAVAGGLAEASRTHLGSASRHALIAAAAFDAVGRDPGAVPALDAAYLRKSEAEINAEKALAKRALIGD
jgi:tRNA threonylcarbamoyladenosine biosynthesis protein TsaB